jgi:small subunit ribosomal protein S9
VRAAAGADAFFSPLLPQIMQPFLATDTLGRFHVEASVQGSSSSSQAGAMVLGIARALQKWDPALRQLMKPKGLMRRDDRMVERKKYNQKKARKKFQWNKR